MSTSYEWRRQEKPIFTGNPGNWDSMIEDFVVVKNNGKYYAFYSGGVDYNFLNGIGLAVSKNPLGPFTRCGNEPIISNYQYTRLGSVIRVGKKWRLYYSIGRGNVVICESDDLKNWDKINLVVEDAIQPCCQIFKGKYLLLATDVKKKENIKERGILALSSKDGVNFDIMKKIITMKNDTEYSHGLSNPSFIVEENKVRIFFEGRKQEFVGKDKGICGWKIFEAIWDGIGEAEINDDSILPPSSGWDGVQTANPNIAKLDGKHYLYYSGGHPFRLGVAMGVKI